MKVNHIRDLIILGHPRSGSYWLQSCMPHFNCREAFNVINFDVVGNNGKKFVLSNYRDIQLDKLEEERQILDRIKLVDALTVPKCTKILAYQINELVLDWINKQDADVVWIKRKDRTTAFKSLLIANQLGKYVDKITDTSVKIDISTIDRLYKVLIDDVRDNQIKNSINKPIEFVFYEDLLNDPSFDKSQSNMEKQDTTAVTIENWEEVVDYLQQNGLSI